MYLYPSSTLCSQRTPHENQDPGFLSTSTSCCTLHREQLASSRGSQTAVEMSISRGFKSFNLAHQAVCLRRVALIRVPFQDHFAKKKKKSRRTLVIGRELACVEIRSPLLFVFFLFPFAIRNPLCTEPDEHQKVVRYTIPRERFSTRSQSSTYLQSPAVTRFSAAFP